MDKIMSMKKKTRVNKEIGAELVKRFQDFNKNIESIMGKSDKPVVVAKNATSQKSIQIYSISDTVNVYLSNCSLKNNEYFGFDLFDYETHETFDTYMDRDKLKGLAVFILNYLEHN